MGDDDRTKVGIDATDVARSADSLWKALAEWLDEERPFVVAHMGRLCRFRRDDETGTLGLQDHDVDTFRDQLTRYVRPMKFVRTRTCGVRAGSGHVHDDDCYEYELEPRSLPDPVAQAILKRPIEDLDAVAPVSRVARVVDVPVFAPDRSLLTRPGHHPAARTYLDPEAPPVATNDEGWDDVEVRYADVENARYVLLEELLGDFPFADEASRAHALALVVEQFARGMIDGPTPAYVIDAPEQGTGKSWLAQAALIPSCGLVDRAPEPEESQQDFQKRLLSELIRGRPAMLFDNVTRPLENSALAAMLTSGRYSDRVLGRSAIESFPVRHTTVFTMNAGVLGPDMRRRVVPIYLDAKTERPWERTGPSAGTKWRHPNLLAWATENRTRLAGAALTLVLHYAKGWTQHGHEGEDYTSYERPTRMNSSFAEWSAVVGGVVTAAGVQGFGENLDALHAAQSDDDSDEAAFLAAWPEGARLTSADVLRLATTGLDGGLPVQPPQALQDRRGHLTTQSVGNGLRQMRGRVRDGRRVVRVPGGSRLWTVEAV